MERHGTSDRPIMSGTAAMRAASARPACAASSSEIPMHPQPSPHALAHDAAMRAALLAGAVPLRDPAKMAMLKPKPMNYTADVSHLERCTMCENLAAARAAARAHRPRMASGAPHLFADDAALAAWANVVLELEAPHKGRARFQQPVAVGVDVGERRKRLAEAMLTWYVTTRR